MRKNNFSSKKLLLAFTASTALLLGGCGTISPLNSSEETNDSMFAGYSDMQKKVDSLRPGMSKSETLAILGVKPEMLTTLDNSQIADAMFGKTSLMVPFEKREESKQYFSTLEGFKLHIRKVDAHNSWSLTHSNKNFVGYDVSYTLVFEKDVLIYKSKPAGGFINEKTREGWLNGFSPMSQVKKTF